MSAGYDFIGDLHGHARALDALLDALGYERLGDVRRHPRGRAAVFVGDLMDRGPDSRGVIARVRAMVEAGEAHCALGNHEFNAVHFATPHPGRRKSHLRPRSDKNLAQHFAFLAEYLRDREAGLEALARDRAWMRSLPPFLDLGGARVAHACWSQRHIDALAAARDQGGALSEAAWIAAGLKDTPLHAAAEIVLKGPETALPEGFSYRDKEGARRRRARLRWWRRDPADWAEAIVAPADLCAALDAAAPAPRNDFAYGADLPPVFFGHYWLAPENGRPWLTADNAACLDFGIGIGGAVGAYRWDGEAVLEAPRLIAADAAGRVRAAAAP